MGGGKGRRGSGSSFVVPGSSPSTPVVRGLALLQQREAEGGWSPRVKLLASSTLGNADRDEGGRTIALTEEDFRKSGFKAREVVAVLAGPSRLIAGRVTPLPSAALRPNSVGLASTSLHSLGCDEGARVRVRRLGDTAITILAAQSLCLVLERGGSSRMQSSAHRYLEAFSEGRRALLHRAVSFTARGCHAREGDLLSVSFEGIPHMFRVAKLLSPRRDPSTPFISTDARPEAEVEEEADSDVVLSRFAALSVSDGLGTPSTPLPPRTPLSHKIMMDDSTQSPVLEEIPSSSFTPLRVGVCTPSPVSSAVAAVENVNHTDSISKRSTSARARLEAFYREHNPEKLGDVSGILDKYAGREADLFAKLERKYGPGSLRAAASGDDGYREGNSDSRLSPETGLSPSPGQHLRRHILQDAAGGTPIRSNGTGTPNRPQGLPLTPGGVNPASVRAWGSNETLWRITARTSIELNAADAPSCHMSTEGKERKVVSTAESDQQRDRQKAHEERQQQQGEWSSVGGLSSQIQQLKEAIQLPLSSPEVLRKYGVRPARGVLLHGPPGTGKTTLARAAAAACGCHVIVVNGSELMSRFVGESEGALRRTFAEASCHAPCLIVFDEVDTLCPRRDEANSEAQRRVVSTMLALLDGVDAKEQVVVIACTNRPQALDPALRRPGRLDSEVEVGVPDEAGRAEILSVLLRAVPHAMTDSNTSPTGGDSGGAKQGFDGHQGITEIAARTHGFVGADLQLLVKESALQALRRTRGTRGTFRGKVDPTDNEVGDHDDATVGEIEEAPTTNTVQRLEKGKDWAGVEGTLPLLTLADFRAALPLVSPSGLREVAVEVPSVRWGDIGGMEGVKQSLREVVEWPLRHPEAFQRMGMSPPRGVLLYGPPGCSKTLMARALATESGMNFLAVKGPELLSKWLGESERAMQGLFNRARAAAPTIVFFDEVDALASTRGGGGEGGAGATERVLTQLLTELDGIQPLKRVVVVAATNRPDVIDPALLRPGRLDRLVYVPPPDTPSRTEILRLSLAKVPAAPDVDRDELARKTEGFSGAEVVALCREASICALEEDRSATQVRQAHLIEALEQMRPQITPQVLAFYASFHGGGGGGA